MISTLRDFRLNDMIAHYTVDENGLVGFILLPEAVKLLENLTRKCQQESMVQIKYEGDIYGDCYAGGVSLRNGQSAKELVFDHQDVETRNDLTIIRTFLKDKRGYMVEHVLTHRKNDLYVKMYNIFTNNSNENVTLEMFESFSMGGITPYVDGDASECLELYRMRSVWSGEGRLQKDSLEELSMEVAWNKNPHAVRCERYGQAGSMPVNHYFPMGAVFDKKTKVFWGAQIAHNTSWQIELYRKDCGVGFSGGIADRELGNWTKIVMPGEKFTTPEALVSCAYMGAIFENKNYDDAREPAFDLFMQRLTEDGKHTVLEGPECEHTLPVMFNEFCTTWGCPSDENIAQIVDAIKDKGFLYFVT